MSEYTAEELALEGLTVPEVVEALRARGILPDIDGYSAYAESKWPHLNDEPSRALGQKIEVEFDPERNSFDPVRSFNESAEETRRRWEHFKPGDVIRFTVNFVENRPSTGYNYAALLCPNGYWYLTGGRVAENPPIRGEKLKVMLSGGDGTQISNVQVSTGWRDLQW